MDSLSQAALGSAIGIAVLGRRTALWKAALIGAFYGTLPDLDAFIDHGDPIRNMTFHRTESHALFYLTLLSPLFAWLSARLFGQRQDIRQWWLAIWLILITHVLLDTMTIYGTQLALPFTDHPYGVGSIFIIDPLYTLPLLIGIIAALIFKGSGTRWNNIGLAVSTLYLVWGLLAQQHVKAIADEVIASENLPVEQRLVVPTAFNSLLWRVLIITPDGYAEGFYSLLDQQPQIDFTHYPRNTILFDAVRGNWEAERIAWFSHGFFKMSETNGKLMISDLRMGQEPFYSFNFVIAEADGTHWKTVTPQHITNRPDFSVVMPWLKRRIQGELIDPPWHGDN